MYMAKADWALHLCACMPSCECDTIGFRHGKLCYVGLDPFGAGMCKVTVRRHYVVQTCTSEGLGTHALWYVRVL